MVGTVLGPQGLGQGAGGHRLFRKVRRWVCLLPPAQGGMEQQRGQGGHHVCRYLLFRRKQVT